jgi:phosphohistidine phosphatase
MEGRELLVLRHGKSSWDSDAATDFDRPLAKRGKRDAPRIGEWLLAEAFSPDLVISSPARRARQTARRATKALGLDPESIVYDERIYYGGMRDTLDILAECDRSFRRVLLAGHNPTLEALVSYLAGAGTSEFQAEKFFPTCALARLILPEDWVGLDAGSASLVNLIRPRTLKS